ncbi:MAG TPA: hypothetical protein VNO52_00335 [Methylomirabilota bacterium]|nr:hypothetical protein [Methylomirabilota bacterium]
MSADNFTQSTVAALTALKTRIAAVQWEGRDAFDKVELFDMTDLPRALRELLTFGNRVCLVILDFESWETETFGQELRAHQTRALELLIADRHWGNRQLALIGGDDTPGALALKDLVLPAVFGLLVAGTNTASGLYCVPGDGELIELQDKARDELAGRIVWRQGLRITGGLLRAQLGKRPIT